MTNFLKQNKLVIVILAIFLGVYGFYSLMTITKEVTPNISIPFYSVVVTYPGADAQTIEEQVTNKLEQRFKSITFLKKITSTTSYNFSVITLEFLAQKKDSDAINDLKSAVDQIYSSLPSDVKYPTIKKIDINDYPAYVFSVASKNSLETLYPIIKPLEDQIKGIKGVSEVSIIGKPSQIIKIDFSFDKLAELNLDIGYIISQLRSSFIKLPADKKQIQGSLYSFEIATYQDDIQSIIQQIKDYEILYLQSKNIKISDIAKVTFTYKGSQKKSFLYYDKDTVSALSFQVSKVPGYDINNFTIQLKELIKEYSNQHPDLKVIEIQSSEKSIKKIYNLFFENFFQTGFLVFLIILVFLGFRSSIIIVSSFILVYLINFRVFQVTGNSFNNIISFGLILILGIMVDNLIVISQGITSSYNENGNIRKAIASSLKNYARPVVFGTLTTIVIFLPMYFGLSGIVGEFMKPFPFVVSTNLAISLVISLIVLPVLFGYFLGKSKIKEAKTIGFLTMLGQKMGRFFHKTNQKKRGSRLTMIVFWFMFLFSFVLIGIGLIKIDFLGDSDSENIWINIKYVAGISTSENQEYTSTLLKDISTHLDQKYGNIIEYIEINLGTLGLQQGIKDPNNIANFSIKLVSEDDRNIKSYKMNEEIQEYLKTQIKPKYNFLQDISSLTLQGGPGGGSKPIGFYLIGDDYNQIGKYIAHIMPLISNIKGVYNLESSLEYTNGRFKYVLDSNKLKQLNTSALSIVTMFAGIKNGEYEPNGILIKDFNEFGNDPISLIGFVDYQGEIDNQKIGNIYLDQIIQKKYFQPELISIDKINGSKAILIQSDKTSDTALGDVTAQINQIIKENPLPQGVRYEASADIQEQQAVGQDLGRSMLIGLFLMYLVLIIQFKNIKYPTIIISSIFLSIAGAIFILAITGMTFSFPAQIGIFGVLGVGVNQMIILIEEFKEFYEKQGESKIPSLQKSIALRFVPIFLTNFTTILGLTILAIKDELFGSMAVAFIGGLLFSFFLTMLYVPSLLRLSSKNYYGNLEK
ncbi:efflux RND transporter permease subunit [Candidatus Gracilibacteria bacterium]|nr:efflux RND transporter permease subunit [Candidatus Gracilibacteria bacterium]